MSKQEEEEWVQFLKTCRRLVMTEPLRKAMRESERVTNIVFRILAFQGAPSGGKEVTVGYPPRP